MPLPSGEASMERPVPSVETGEDVITVNCFEMTDRQTMSNNAIFSFFCGEETLAAGICPIKWLENPKVCVLFLTTEDGFEQQAIVDVVQSSIRTADNPAHRKQVGSPAFAGQMRRYFTGIVRELRIDPPVPANAPAGSPAASPEAK